MKPDLRCFVPPLRPVTITALLTVCSLGVASLGSRAEDSDRPPRHEFTDELRHELLEQSRLPRSPVTHASSAAAVVSFGRFTSYQVNVDATGANIVGDDANEPSIAVDPTDPSKMAIGFRQFDNPQAPGLQLREAGYGYSSDGGLTWHTGKIEPGVFRSDPVLASNAEGKFFYLSNSDDPVTGDITTTLFSSTDHGQTWGGGVFAFGDDKPWMTIDRTAGIGHGHVYESWSPSTQKMFTRSNDGGQTFQDPTSVPKYPFFGTLDVGPDGTVYLSGKDFRDRNYVAVSKQAQNAALPPTFDTDQVDLGGTIAISDPVDSLSVNHGGLLGQPWIAVDRSNGPRSGWVYVLCSVQTATDPCDVMFIRSTDGGKHWSAPVRVNDDPIGNRAYQWFGTMSVAPNGRIDAVWNDTRGLDSTRSALRYSCSNDGGVTWSPSEQASPVWAWTLGFPRATKIGDYYQMISDATGADLAWAATFNGEQDVYFMRITPPANPIIASRTESRLGIGVDTPNPITSSATIHFDLPGAGARAKVEVFDASGRRVAKLVDGFVKGGAQSVHWAGTDDGGRSVKSGLYLCRIEAAGSTETVKLMLRR